ILGAATFCALVVLAQISPVDRFERGLRSHPGGQKIFTASAQDSSLKQEIRVFYIDGVQYWATIGEEALLSGPDWTPSKPLPLDFTKVEGIARQELRRFISEDSTWEVAGFHLRSVRVGALDIDDLRRSASRAP